MPKARCVIALVLTITACAQTSRLHIPGADARVPTAAIVLGALDLHLAEVTSWQHHARQRDILRRIESSPYDAIAAFEFDAIARPASPSQWLSHTNLAPSAERMGLSPERLVVLTVSLENAYSEQHVQLSTQIGTTTTEERADTSKSKLYAMVTLVHPTTGALLLRTQRASTEDRFVEVDSADARPQLTRFLQAVMDEVFATLQAHNVLQPVMPKRPEVPPHVRENALGMLPHAYAGVSLREHLAQMDPVIAHSVLYNQARASTPTISLAQYEQDRRAPLGLQLLASAGSLNPGDRIICVDGAPVVGTWQWRRAYRHGEFRQVTRATEAQTEAQTEAVSPTKVAPPSPPPEDCMRSQPATSGPR